MATLDMKGSYPLTDEKIDDVVTRTSAGNYALGHKDDDTFIVQYIGRSDSDVNKRLHKWVGGKYNRFKYSYSSSPKAAFERECRNYHDFGENEKLDNSSHPDRPDGSGWECPVCDIFD